MPVLSTGKTFSATEQITSTNLHNIANTADFPDTSGNPVDSASSTGTCVNGGGIEVTSGGQLQIKDSEVTTAKIADSSSKTTGVTFAKMQHISTAKVLGRASASEGDVEEAFDFKDEDNMSSNSATALASQQSIKAYVTAMRPKFVTLTGGTVALVNERTASGTGTFTYNISGFTSGDSDFSTSKIVGLVVAGFARSNELTNEVQVSLPDATDIAIVSAFAGSGSDDVASDTLTTVPINSDTTTFKIKLIVNNTASSDMKAKATIMGAIIHPGL